MRKAFGNYIRFTKTEQRGIILLSALVLLLLTLRMCMGHFIKSASAQVDSGLLAAWSAYKQTHLVGDQEASVTSQAAIRPFAFDPNTLDSNGFVQLGLRTKTIHMLLNWRRKGKVFYAKEEFKAVYTLREEEYQLLEPFITIHVQAPSDRYHSFYNQEPLPDKINLNTADSALLVRLYGIGPTLAHKIIEKRKVLGGFIKYEQLNEVYHFQDTVFKLLTEQLTINSADIHRLKLNGATLEQLKAHPYIGEKMAKNILMYREGLKRFENIDQLRQVPLMNEENYRKIAPYFTLE